MGFKYSVSFDKKMSRKDAQHVFKPHRDWIKSINDAWERVGRGTKGELLERANVSKSTQDRMRNLPNQVGLDSWEAMRRILVKHFAATPTPVEIPPPVVVVHSPEHYKALSAVTAANDTGQLDLIAEWMELGGRMARLGILEAVTEAVRERVESEEAIATSNDRLDAAIRIARESSSEMLGTKRRGRE